MRRVTFVDNQADATQRKSRRLFGHVLFQSDKYIYSFEDNQPREFQKMKAILRNSPSADQTAQLFVFRSAQVEVVIVMIRIILTMLKLYHQMFKYVTTKERHFNEIAKLVFFIHPNPLNFISRGIFDYLGKCILLSNKINEIVLVCVKPNIHQCWI